MILTTHHTLPKKIQDDFHLIKPQNLNPMQISLYISRNVEKTELEENTDSHKFWLLVKELIEDDSLISRLPSDDRKCLILGLEWLREDLKIQEEFVSKIKIVRDHCLNSLDEERNLLCYNSYHQHLVKEMKECQDLSTIIQVLGEKVGQLVEEVTRERRFANLQKQWLHKMLAALKMDVAARADAALQMESDDLKPDEITWILYTRTLTENMEKPFSFHKELK